MIIEAMFLADAVASPPGGKLYVHGGGISGLNAPALPLVLPQLAVVARFRIEDSDTAKWPESLAVQLLEPSGNTMAGPFKEPFPAFEALAAAGPPPYAVHFCPTFGGVIFPEAGEYAVTVLLDNETVGDMRFVVRSPGQPWIPE